MTEQTQILLTNDDGIRSPGLWAAAEALQGLGYVTVVAPRDQWSGAGRSLPSNMSGRIHLETICVDGKEWQAYAIEGTPAQAVQHAILEVLPRPPDLVVAGINYGENVGSGVTISGTVGAALEGACFGLPALAVSLETEVHFNLSYSTAVDFSAARSFTEKFARLLLGWQRPDDVDVLKVDVPQGATPATPWRLTRVSRQRYYVPSKPKRQALSDAGQVGYQRYADPALVEADSDVKALLDHCVSVTPLSQDVTSRVPFGEFRQLLARQLQG